MASLQPDDAVRYLARRGAGRAALLALALAAACGGDRNRPASGDTTGAATVTPDTAAMRGRDSTMSADTAKSMTGASKSKAPSASATRPAAPADTGAKHAAPTAATGKQMAIAEARTAHDSAKAPSPQAKRDTARVQQADSAKSAAAPAPAPTPQQQDTTSKTTATADAPLRDAYHQAPHDTVSQAVYDGWKQFNLNCARCHGEDALGTTIAPHLILSLKPDGPINTKELFMQTVCAGRPAKGMPAWCALGLGMDKISNIYDYVKGRSDAKISPGRPAVKQQG
ncbi:MAG TPA: c-type cytochrome [Gemmatimonadales bacterium]|nr:c-type cytochrome [Gemmatimonadales bacterium]